MSDTDKKPGKKYPKLCSKCGIEKPESGWTPETYTDPNSTICKKCAEGKKPAKKKPAKKKPAKEKRKSSQREGLPKVYSLESLESQVVEINASIEKDGAVLLTWFRDNLGKPGSMPAISKETIESVIEIFNEHSVRDLDWPKVKRITDTKRTTHPFISDVCRLALVVENQRSIHEDEHFQDALTYAVHDFVLQEAKKRWTILGDETGQFEEFVGKTGNDGRQSTMIWVVVPPSSSLPAIPNLYFHSTTGGDIDSTIRELLNDSNVRLYSFTYDDGEVVQGQSKIGGDPHLYMWNDTLPLVLEHLLHNEKVELPVQVFVEQVKELQSGIGVLDSVIAEYKTALKTRKWSELESKETFVLQKNPCEHPWLGYPDALGHFFSPTPEKKLGKNFTPVQQRLLASPYRQSSLNGSIRQLHKDTARPLIFLKSLSEITLEDHRDYVEVFFSQAIIDSLDSLHEGDWQKLLAHMDATSKTKQGQSATTLIHQRVDIDATLSKLTRQSDQFDFCLAMLGTSNHIGAKAQAERCQNEIDNLLENGFEPRKERAMKYKNLSGGKNDNVFNFNHIETYTLDSRPGEEEMKFLGAQAQSRALRSYESDVDEALEIEKFLFEHTVDEDDKLRRILLHAELLMVLEDSLPAYEFLTSTLFTQISRSKEDLMTDAYYVATLVKAGCLSGQGENVLQEISEHIPRLLSDYHPSQRIAYWCARWVNSLGFDMPKLLDTCLRHLEHLSIIPFFTHDAPGLILSCELLDLSSRGNQFGVSVDEIYESVKLNSEPSTKQWISENPPTENDWLAPLNFNYR